MPAGRGLSRDDAGLHSPCRGPFLQGKPSAQITDQRFRVQRSGWAAQRWRVYTKPLCMAYLKNSGRVPILAPDLWKCQTWHGLPKEGPTTATWDEELLARTWASVPETTHGCLKPHTFFR